MGRGRAGVKQGEPIFHALPMPSVSLAYYPFQTYNEPVEIEYDDHKDRINRRKHGIGLAVARILLSGAHLEERDERFQYGEERYVATGAVGSLVLVCAYTMRGETYRIISVRQATRGESGVYYQAFGS